MAVWLLAVGAASAAPTPGAIQPWNEDIYADDEEIPDGEDLEALDEELEEAEDDDGATWDIQLADPDDDELSNVQEEELGTDPDDEDTDGDGIPDGLEVVDGMPARMDEDLDTDPLRSDTDSGGMRDGDEVRCGSDPLNPDDDDACRRALVRTGDPEQTSRALLAAAWVLRGQQHQSGDEEAPTRAAPARTPHPALLSSPDANDEDTRWTPGVAAVLLVAGGAWLSWRRRASGRPLIPTRSPTRSKHRGGVVGDARLR
ncbi:MAG: hypothetical protein AB2A00_37220 [Myxococcota bacterium]